MESDRRLLDRDTPLHQWARSGTAFMTLRRVIGSEKCGASRYTGYVAKSIKLKLDCGHEDVRIASRGVPRFAKCSECARTDGGKLTDHEAEEILAKVSAGRSLHSLVACKGAPHSSWRFRLYYVNNPDYARQIRQVATTNAIAATKAKRRSRSEALTHCRWGHPYAEFGVRRPTARGSASWVCRHCRNTTLKQHGGGRPTAEQIEKVRSGIIAGLPLSAMTARASDPRYVMNWHALRKARLADSDFDQIVSEWTSTRYLRISHSLRGRSRPRAATATADNSAYFGGYDDKDYAQIKAMIPRSIPFQARDDIAQDIMLALLEGRAGRDGIAGQVKLFVGRHLKQFPIHFAHRSLDASIRQGGDLRLGDAISEGLW